MRKNTIFKITLIVFLLVLPFISYMYRRSYQQNFLENNLGWIQTVIPVPEEVTGIFLLRACLSEDNSALVVIGRPPMSPKDFVHMMRDVKFGEEEVIRLTPQKIYVSAWPPKKSEDYRFLAELPGISQILTCAISPDGETLAFVSRERSWSNDKRYAVMPILNKNISYKDTSLNDVLYTVSLKTGGLVPLVIVQSDLQVDGLPRSPFSMCWNSMSDRIYCFDAGSSNRVINSSIQVIDMSGNISLVKQMPNKTIVASNMVCVDDELQFFTYRTGGGMMGSDSVYTRMKTDGTVLSTDTKVLSNNNFLPISGTNFSPILISKDNIIAHSTNIMPLLPVMAKKSDFREIDIDNFQKNRTHSFLDDGNGFPYAYFLCQFLKNDKDFLFVKYLDIDGGIAKNLRRVIEDETSLYRRAREANAPITQLILMTQKK